MVVTACMDKFEVRTNSFTQVRRFVRNTPACFRSCAYLIAHYGLVPAPLASLVLHEYVGVDATSCFSFDSRLLLEQSRYERREVSLI